MRTVADLISAGSALRVRCRNCGHEHFFTARFLKARIGFTGNLFEARYTCSICKKSSVTIAPAAPPTAEHRISPSAAFGGVYAKYDD